MRRLFVSAALSLTCMCLTLNHLQASVRIRVTNRNAEEFSLMRVSRTVALACFRDGDAEPRLGVVRRGLFKAVSAEHRLAKAHPQFAAECSPEEDAGLVANVYSVVEEAPSQPLFAITASRVPGDYNGDGCNNGSDFLAWQRGFGSSVAPDTGADGNGDGAVNAADYTVWRNNLGAGNCSAGTPVIVPIPEIEQWKAQMIHYGDLHCQKLRDAGLTFDSKLANTYYDAEWVFYQIGDFTKDSKWYECAQNAEDVYRNAYVLPNHGNVPGYWNFSHGVQRDFLSTGDSTSHAALLALSDNASYAPDWTPLSWTEDSTMSREVAYAIMSYLNAQATGQPEKLRLNALVQQAFGHLDQWFIKRNAPYVRPFMFSLTAHALISYEAHTGRMKQEIITALTTGSDWIWNNMWLADRGAFKYTDRFVESGGTEPAPDLNLLIAPVYAWLWHQTGNPVFRDRGDQIFAGGVKSAYLVNGKQFNQNYRWSFDYVKWRSQPPLK